MQDLLNNQGNYLSPQEFSNKYNIKVNFLQYYQITSAIPTYLKSSASAHMDLGDLSSICENFDFHLSKDITLNLKKTLCKQFYKLFVEEINTVPTAIKSRRIKLAWSCWQLGELHPKQLQLYKITRDNKLRQFYFKLLHRILVTNQELKRFGITDCDKCVMCGKNDSIEHAFWVIFSEKIPLSWHIKYCMLWAVQRVDQWVDQWEMYVCHTNKIGSTIKDKSNFLLLR